MQQRKIYVKSTSYIFGNIWYTPFILVDDCQLLDLEVNYQICLMSAVFEAQHLSFITITIACPNFGVGT